MDSKDHIAQLKEIRQMMAQSSRFISLSGLSGIFSGLYASAGALYAWDFLRKLENPEPGWADLYPLLLTAGLVFGLTVITAFVFTLNKARKHGQKIWDDTAQRLLVNLLIPVISGGIICIALIDKGYFDLLAPSMLIFYGIALFNGGRYTLKDIRYLGLCEMLAGFICLLFPEYGIWFWTFGFGALHMIYGTWMYFRYEK